MAYGGAWHPPGKASACYTRRTYVLAICKVGYLGCTRCKRGVALVKFQTFPISYVVTGHIYRPMTKLTREVKEEPPVNPMFPQHTRLEFQMSICQLLRNKLQWWRVHGSELPRSSFHPVSFFKEWLHCRATVLQYEKQHVY